MALPSRQPGLSLSMSQQEGPGDILSCASLSEAKIREDSSPATIAQLALPAGKPSPAPIMLLSPIHSPSKHHVSSMCLASACASVSADITLPISPSPRKRQETAAHQQKVLVSFFLWSPNLWSSTMQYKVDQNMHTISKESFITCPFMCSP